MSSLLDICRVTITVLYSMSGARHLAYTFSATPTLAGSVGGGAGAGPGGVDRWVTLATCDIKMVHKSCIKPLLVIVP